MVDAGWLMIRWLAGDNNGGDDATCPAVTLTFRVVLGRWQNGDQRGRRRAIKGARSPAPVVC